MNSTEKQEFYKRHDASSYDNVRHINGQDWYYFLVGDYAKEHTTFKTVARDMRNAGILSRVISTPATGNASGTHVQTVELTIILVQEDDWMAAERYFIPDYLPAQDASAEAEAVDETPAPEEPVLSEGLTNAIRAIWERHFEMVDAGEAALGASMIKRERAKYGNHPAFETIGNEVRADWKARTLDAPEEPAATDDDDVFEWPVEVREVALKRENASLQGQIEALRIRFAEMEAENAKLHNHVIQVEKARDFWRGKKEETDIALDVQRATSEQWETRAKAAEAILKAFHS